MTTANPSWLKEDPDFHQLRVIRSHAGLFRFMAENLEHVGDPSKGDLKVAGWIPTPGHIPSPYMFSGTRSVHVWGDHFVVIFETAHKVYRVFSVNPRLVLNTEEQALDAYMASRKAKAKP